MYIGMAPIGDGHACQILHLLNPHRHVTRLGDPILDNLAMLMKSSGESSTAMCSLLFMPDPVPDLVDIKSWPVPLSGFSCPTLVRRAAKLLSLSAASSNTDRALSPGWLPLGPHSRSSTSTRLF